MVDPSRDYLYKMQFHDIKPDRVRDYEKLCEAHLPKVSSRKDVPIELVGSFKTWYGRQDHCMHIWKYKDQTYKDHQNSAKILAEDEENRTFRSERAKLLRSRQSVLTYEFGFWPATTTHNDKVYELRVYDLKPGNLSKFAVSWAQVLQQGLRGQDGEIAAGGFFTDVGKLNRVFHLWAYDDLQSRLACRNNTYDKPQWAPIVTETQAYCRSMETMIMTPMNHSPMS